MGVAGRLIMAQSISDPPEEKSPTQLQLWGLYNLCGFFSVSLGFRIKASRSRVVGIPMLSAHQGIGL